MGKGCQVSSRSSRNRIALVALACFFANAGCTLALNHDKQCSSDSDCSHFSPTARCVNEICADSNAGSGGSGSSGNDWSCLGRVVTPQRGNSMIKIAMSFFDFIEQSPVISGFVVRPCSKMDVECTSPLSLPVSPDQQGVATITVPAGFDGYAEVIGVSDSGDGGPPKYAPTLVFFNPPPVADTSNTMTAMFAPESLAALAGSNGTLLDPTLGSLASGAFDCKSQLAAGVTLEPDRSVESTRRFYYIDGLPNFAASATGPAGYGGLINLPIGTIRLTAKLQATGQTIASASVFTRAGYLAQVDVTPTP